MKSDSNDKNAKQYEQLSRMYQSKKFSEQEENNAEIAADVCLTAFERSNRAKEQDVFKVVGKRLEKGDAENMGSCDSRYLQEMKIGNGKVVQKVGRDLS